MPVQHDYYGPARPGIDKFPANAVLPRHRHDHGYASVVLAGRFTEASFWGLMPAKPGDVLLHGPFDCHSDYGQGGGGTIQILRLPWVNGHIEGHFHVSDPDELVRVAKEDPQAAMELLALKMRPAHATNPHWTHVLALALRSEGPLSLQEWAARTGVRPEALSRGFRRYFGTSPKLYRLEARSRRAWQKVVQSTQTLTTIAHECGFADLAHLSRSVRALTGASPSAWRASLKSVQTESSNPNAPNGQRG